MSARADAWLDSLGRLVRDTGRARVRVGDIVAAAGEGGLAAAILIFALSNALPSLPGMSSVLGAPLLVFAAQMLLGRVAGGLGCVLAMLLALPLPRVNIPIGMSLSLLSFALRGDGLAVLLGFVAGIVSLVLAASVCWGAWLLL
ncbi:exopolysaccharide biosynthesis protein [Variovorax sp. EBFNA2]|uniref:exopolysaccharide biosynthesis protein n=1 Tax=Variovorax sp. EBFNA2 TaxID=3342097 RepID=UPI0029C077E5|nr:exopolysaccharide biosynthesis protein [Variovorax boronicumulans]WPG41377.1 exopolysaccharide biosynthesis protein [Variovorax boronicumulans]